MSDVSAPERVKAGKLVKTGARAEKGAVQVSGVNLTAEQRQQLVREAAYFRAEARGFGEGLEEQDWLAAEAELDSQHIDSR